MPSNKFADIILPLALPRLYTYSIPSEFEGMVEQGKRVVVQFGKKKLYSAIVHGVHNKAPEKYQTKDILQGILYVFCWGSDEGCTSFGVEDGK